jgi:hypothetical protein
VLFVANNFSLSEAEDFGKILPAQRQLLSIDSTNTSVQNSRQSLNASSVPHRDDHAFQSLSPRAMNPSLDVTEILKFPRSTIAESTGLFTKKNPLPRAMATGLTTQPPTAFARRCIAL